MNIIELILLSIGLSMDAFAVAICIGLTLKKAAFKSMLIVGLYFGIFQAGMPLIGFFTARLFAEKIITWDHWIAFALLSFLGGKMIIGSFKKETPAQPASKNPAIIEQIPASLKIASMLPLAVATSIDALAVGVSFAFLQVKILPAVILIGITTLVISMAGVKIGNLFGSRFKSKAEITGGIILILIGLKILFEHL